MAISRKLERELIRTHYLDKVSEYLNGFDDVVLRVKSNEIAIPVVGCEGNDDYLVITFKVPTGANKGAEPYDGFAEADNYAHELAEKARKASEREAEKARKIERDRVAREKRAKAKAEATDKQLSVNRGVS